MFQSHCRVDISKGLTINHMTTHPPNAKYPDATAITYDEQNFKVTVVYNDHSIYVWDVRDIKKVFKDTLRDYSIAQISAQRFCKLKSFSLNFYLDSRVQKKS